MAYIETERTLYHVVGDGWAEGQDLLSWDELESLGESLTWKYDGEPFDTDVICLFETLTEAEAFRSEYGGTILAVTLPAETYTTTVSEGFTAVPRRIPGEWVAIA